MFDFELTKNKFESAYFVAKQELPLGLLSKLLSLEKRHDTEIGTAHQNCNYANLQLVFWKIWLMI